MPIRKPIPMSAQGAAHTNRWHKKTASESDTAGGIAMTVTNDSLATAEDTALVIDPATLLANDTAPEGGTLTVAAVGNARGGSVAMVDGSIVFTPDPDYNGQAGFDYTVTDDTGLTQNASVAVQVNAVNDAPQAQPRNLLTWEDTPLAINTWDLVYDATDIDGDTVTVESVGNAVGGTVTLVDGTVTFNPDANFHGEASFTVTVTDGNGGTATATATVQVFPSPDAPVAADDTFATSEDTPLVVTPAELMANDANVDGGALTLIEVGWSTGGTATLVDGNVVFTPDPDFNGQASFTYVVVNEAGHTSSAVATVNVGAVNDAPTVQPLRLTTFEDAPLTLQPDFLPWSAFDIDGDTLSVSAVGNPEGGTVEIVDGNVVFIPAPNFNGEAGFDLTVSDGAGGFTTTRVAVTVEPMNDEPIAVDDILDIQLVDGAAIIDFATLLANDSDPEGDPLTFAGFGGVIGGNIYAFDDTSAQFFLWPGYAGQVVIDYYVADSSGYVSRATAGFEIPNAAPVAVADLLYTGKDSPLWLSGSELTANDTDADGHLLHVTAVGNATHGTVTLNPWGIQFTPDTGFHGEASFEYTVDDGYGVTSTAIATVQVGEPNTAPGPMNDWFNGVEDQPLVLQPADLLANDYDVDGDTLTIVAVGDAQGGTVALVDGTVVFTPDPGFSGVATFVYTVDDGYGGTSQALSYVDVAPVNSAPVASDDTLVVDLVDGMVNIDTALLLANDTDADGEVPRVTAIANVVGGQAFVSWDRVIFTPDPDFAGQGSFEYTITDDSGATSTATATFTIGGTNHSPVTEYDEVAASAFGQPVIITPAQLLANDVDYDGDTLSVTGVSDASNGTVVIGSDGNIVFTPDQGFSGQTTFYYTVTDSRGASTNQYVLVNVPPAGGVATVTPVLANTHEAVLDSGLSSFPHQTASLVGGGHVVGWYNSRRVYAQVVGQDGNPVGTPIVVASAASSHVPVVGLADGGFMVGWDGGLAQRFNADGTRNGAAFTVGSSSFVYFDSLTRLANGDVVATYSLSDGEDGDGWGVFGRIIGADGTMGSQFQVNTPTAAMQQRSSVTELADGSFVVNYWSQGTYPVAGVTRYQMFDADGTKRGDDRVMVNVDSYVTMIPHGSGFIAAWTAWGGANYTQAYDAEGNALGAPVEVWQGGGWGSASLRALDLADGGYLLWSGNSFASSGNADIVAQRFDANGVPVTERFRIHSGADYHENTATATQRADGSIAFTWTDYDGSDRHIRTSVLEEITVRQGNTAANTIGGDGGTDLLVGGNLQDTFLAGPGSGADIIDNRGHGDDGDRVLFGTGVDTDQLWFQREGDALKVSVIGTADSVAVADWYQTEANHVSSFQTTSGHSLSHAQVENLVQAMSSFAPPALGQTELTADQHQALDTVIAANWQHS